MEDEGRVLILGNPQDLDVTKVTAHLRQPPVIIDPYAVKGLNTPLSYRIHGSTLRIKHGGHDIPRPIRTVWVRQPLDADHPLIGPLMTSFPEARWISPPAAIADAERIPYHLMVAQQAGFVVADTIVTPSQEEAARFVASVGRCVQIDKGQITPCHEEESWFATKKVRVLQQRVTEEYGVHITVVGSRVFAARVSDIREQALINPAHRDWRHALALGLCEVHEFTLPKRIKERCVTLIQALNLVTGVIELSVREQDPKYILLRVNPTGTWTSVASRAGLRVSRAFAQLIEQ